MLLVEACDRSPETWGFPPPHEQPRIEITDRALCAARAELEAEVNKHPRELRVLQEKAATTNEKSTAMLKTTADLIAAVGFFGTIGSPIDEWKECRTTIDRFDKILVDPRKTGFGFVTVIAAAAQFLFTDVNAFAAKAALLAMLVVLIITLYLIDLQHQEWLDVTVERAKAIEKDRFFWDNPAYEHHFRQVQPLPCNNGWIYPILSALGGYLRGVLLLCPSLERTSLLCRAGVCRRYGLYHWRVDFIAAEGRAPLMTSSAASAMKGFQPLESPRAAASIPAM